MAYTALSDEERQLMLDVIGIKDVGEIFSTIPDGLKLKRPLELPKAMDEASLKRAIELPAPKPGFLGGGIYNHHIPALVDALASRQEFYTAYTPYQPEISQGTLQSIFEYQSMLTSLTGMHAANASMYDGATALAEAALMAIRKKRTKKILVSRATNPAYRRVLETYIKHFDAEMVEVDFNQQSGQLDLDDLRAKLDKQSALFVQQPNYFGVIEEMDKIAEIAADAALWGIVIGEAISLGLLEKPGSYNPDVVVGEAQSFGNPVAGPFLGFFCTTKEYLRQMPGRIVGMTKDSRGQDAFCLTLSTREQHIRRAKATSNICSNQGLCALRASIYLSAMGPGGLRKTAVQSANGARYLRELFAAKGVKPLFDGPIFNEFVISADAELKEKIAQSGYAPGIAIDYPELKDATLFSVTELNTQEDCQCLTEKI